jgi:sialate O-acetylesterase
MLYRLFIKKIFSRSFLFLLLQFVLNTNTFAKIKLPAFFSDNMVLQQKSAAAIWGKAAPNTLVIINGSWDKKTITVRSSADGSWKTSLATPAAGGPYTIRISDGTPLLIRNVLIGEVWLCSGQSNMEMPMKGFKDQPINGSNDAIFSSANNHIRLYIVPRGTRLQRQDTTKNSSWKIAGPEAVSNFSATAYYFARILQQQLQVPVGLVNISYGGSPAEAFMSAEALKAFPEIKIPPVNDTSIKVTNKIPTTLYNSMLYPFIGFTIKGCIWYQGESNYDRPDQYEKLFPALVESWRNEFGLHDFPFYFTQIAPYQYAPPANVVQGVKYNSAYLRDAQRKALQKIPNSGMVVLTDAGEENSIHPANKEIVGKRFAYLCLAKTYGQKGFGYCSPAFDSLKISGNTATIKFTDAPNGLTSFGKPLQLFEIAGADKHFYPAKASISRGMVQLSAAEVKEPVAVRYAFTDFVNGDLFSTEGFPVSSFRTDDW